jgi:transcriptional regulator with XRE-family HTH domain
MHERPIGMKRRTGRPPSKKNPQAGKRLRYFRETKGLTRAQLVEEEGWKNVAGLPDHWSTVYRWEREGIPENKIVHVARFFNMTPDDLASGRALSEEDIRRKNREFSDLLYDKLKPENKSLKRRQMLLDFDWPRFMRDLTLPPGTNEKLKKIQEELKNKK